MDFPAGLLGLFSLDGRVYMFQVEHEMHRTTRSIDSLLQTHKLIYLKENKKSSISSEVQLLAKNLF